MDLEVKLFNPAASYARPSRSPRRTTSRFELLTEGQLWTLHEPLLH